jgi:N6-L-threonylcarbamoyladenine synthase
VLVLGIETSCDETSIALVRDGVEVLANVVRSQVARHARFGGVVPEIAAREHVVHLLPALNAALDLAKEELASVDLIAVTERPGLQAALLSGIALAEALAIALDRPLVGVNHIEAHLGAPFLARSSLPQYPFVSLVVSGGHTHLFRSSGVFQHELLGATLDDAAGEAFDKVAKLLGLGYPGGPAIQAAALAGSPNSIALKRPLLGPRSLDFSFSGLKTAVLYTCFGQDPTGRPLPSLKAGTAVADVAASFQACVVDVLVEKARRALHRTGLRRLAVGGGVACNRPLRDALIVMAAEEGTDLWHAPPAYCSDNAAMIAARGFEVHRTRGGRVVPLAPAPRAVWPRLEWAES